MDNNNMTEEEAFKIIESGLSQHMNEAALIPALCIVMANVVRRLKALEVPKNSTMSDLEKLTGQRK